MHPFSGGRGFLNAGVNTLVMQITPGNTDNFEEGARLTGTVGPSSATPEPSSLLLLGSGALGLAGKLRRKLFSR